MQWRGLRAREEAKQLPYGVALNVEGGLRNDGEALRVELVERGVGLEFETPTRLVVASRLDIEQS